MLLLILLTLMSSAASSEVARLEEFLKAHPGDALAHYQLGLAYREMGDNRKATLNLRAAIDGGFNNLGASLNLMEAAFASGQSALGLETAERILTPALTSVDVLLRIGQSLFGHLFYKAALQAYEQATHLAPGAFEPRFRLALTYYLLQNYRAAIEQLKLALGVQSSAEAISLLASAEAKSGNFDEAIKVLRDSIEKDPKSPHAYINLALIYLDRGNRTDAETILAEFQKLEIHGSAKVFYTVTRNSCRQLADALEQREGPLRGSPERGELYYRLALQFQERLNYLSAVELIRLAQINEGNSVRLLLAAGTNCLSQDPLAPEPLRLLHAAIAGDPKLHQAFYLLGLAYARQGKLDEAVSAHRRAMGLHPMASYCVTLGKELRDRQSAIAEFEHALTLDNSYTQAHLELGRVYVQTEQFGRARLELERAVHLEPDLYEADYLLGRVYHRIGEEERSRMALKQFAEKKNALLQRTVGDGR